MISKKLTLLASGYALAGCAALQQAPLVYSSKVSLGVDVSATSTETPGISLTLGYKQVDAAYVPVAVAKECKSTNDSTCTNEIFKIIQINGDANIAGKSAPTPSQVEAEKTRRDYEQAVIDSNTAKNSFDAATSNLTQLNARKAQLQVAQTKASEQAASISDIQKKSSAIEAKKVGEKSLSPEDEAELNRLKTLLQSTQILAFSADQKTELDGLDKKIIDAQSNLTAALTEYNEKKIGLEKLAPVAKLAEQLNNLSRKDSYSVYGRFEADTGVKTNAASVGLGKVFSTGVASQSLAQGLGDYYKNLGMAACYDAVARMKTDKSTQDEVAQWLKDCRGDLKGAL